MGKERGFTLVELMVVVTIIGALIAIVLPRIGGMVDRARESSTATNLARIQAAVDDFISTRLGGNPPINQQAVNNMFNSIVNNYFGGNLPRVNLRRGLQGITNDTNDIVYLNYTGTGPNGFSKVGAYDTDGNGNTPNALGGGWGYIINDTFSAVGFSRVGELIINAAGTSLVTNDQYYTIPARR